MGPPWYWTRVQGAAARPDLRVSDAERTQVADTLSKHYAEGRLDQAEFDERLQRAMSAKTRSDLAGLLSDLPPLEGPPSPPPHRHRRSGLLLIAFVFVAAALATSDWGWHDGWHFPWLLFWIVLFVLWRRSRWHWHRHWRRGWGPPVPPPPPPPGAVAPWGYTRRGWWF